MHREEADSQPTHLAVSGVCGLIQANSRTVSEDGRLILAAFHTVTEHKNSGLERNHICRQIREFQCTKHFCSSRTGRCEAVLCAQSLQYGTAATKVDANVGVNSSSTARRAERASRHNDKQLLAAWSNFYTTVIFVIEADYIAIS